MPQPASPISTLYRIEARPDGVALVLAGDWGASAQLPTTQRIVAEVLGARTHDAAPVVIDGTELASAHPRVAAVVYGVNEQLRMRSVEVRYEDLPDSVHALVTLARPAQPEEGRRDRAHWLNRLGKRGGRRVASVADTAELIGNAFAATPKLAVGKAQARWVDFMALIRETGAASLPVVTVVNLLIGAVLGFVGAVQLATFGAGLYLADLVGIAVAREMAAIMTAFIMAGRIGATFAAHLATMEANEEIDALRMIGVSPFEFLVLPRLTALTLMMPLLFLYAAALGIGGGMIVADVVLNTSPASFLGRLQDAVAMRHFVIGFIKAVCFGVLIALASCYLGMRAGRNAAEVGRAATRTVVVSIIGIIVIDAIFALCTNALGV
ncbi:ABC transporter permease [Salinisphaera sp.]|uniref:MlaE family ABC transporter permease n=1 Tax=Salinisphaera sp. TaxID=1914330 RepID=UPI0025F04408|nr:ABC transporter permease [Salinisphaera sp.]